MNIHEKRVLSGMRPTGRLHLGHYHGVLKNWINLQHQYDCYFFVADWHALTTDYDNTSIINDSVWQMIIDWLSAGINPGMATLFIQSKIPEHAELNLLLSMITPLGWLERVPSYKDQREKLKGKDLGTIGFLGYPLLQSADILVYKAGLVPVGEDQVAHIELTREVARRFNHIYGKAPDFAANANAAIKKMGKKAAKIYLNLRKKIQEQGDDEAIAVGRALLDDQKNLKKSDSELLLGFLVGESKIILPEPESLLTEISKMPGLDGQKMSKSYGNTIGLREEPESIEKKIKTMPTDPARIRKTDPGDPKKCPVWQFHESFSPDDVKTWVMDGCTTAEIGCIECKKHISDRIIEEMAPIRERSLDFVDNPALIRNIMTEGCEVARDVAKDTLNEVRQVMGLHY